jgi:large subunit ribosomal protein L31
MIFGYTARLILEYKENIMAKANIHPKYEIVQVKCSCGSSFETCSTLGKEILNIETCNKCHPVYIGKNTAAKTTARVDEFNKKFGQRKKIGVKADEVKVEAK